MSVGTSATDTGPSKSLTESGGGLIPLPPHQGSRDTEEGIIICVEFDWCFMPDGSVVPFIIYAKQSDDANTTTTVLLTSLRTHTSKSLITTCYGDEPAVAGIRSGTVQGICWPATWSPTVRHENGNVVRDCDYWRMNGGNCLGKLFYIKNTDLYEMLQPQMVERPVQYAAASVLVKTATDATGSAAFDAALKKIGQTGARAFMRFFATSPYLVGPTALVTGGAIASKVGQAQVIASPESFIDQGGNPSIAASAVMTDEQRDRKIAENAAGAEKTIDFIKSLFGAKTSAQVKAQTQANVRSESKVNRKDIPCPCTVDTYEKMAPICAFCGAQAHHIVPDSHLGMGNRPERKAGDRIKYRTKTGQLKKFPSFQEGAAICMKGNAKKKNTQHHRAHSRDAAVRAKGRQSKVCGTAPFSYIREETVKSAIAARPECKKEIIQGVKKIYKGVPADALCRATYNPIRKGNPAFGPLSRPKPLGQ